MQNSEKFVELAQKLGLSPKALEQYMACKNAETNEPKSFIQQPRPAQAQFSYTH